MNHRIRRCAPILIGTFILFALIGCGRRAQTLTIRTYIDGSDVIKVSGNSVWFEHEEFDLPGRNGGVNYPTYINGVAWMPEWTDKTSAPYTAVNPRFWPLNPQKIKLLKRIGRGSATVVDTPTTASGTLAIRIDDNAEGGAAWYEVVVSW